MVGDGGKTTGSVAVTLLAPVTLVKVPEPLLCSLETRVLLEMAESIAEEKDWTSAAFTANVLAPTE
jgi:hypothetical protein